MSQFPHFIAAQSPIYPAVLAELGAGRKASHWMWYIFPQLRALGRSATAQKFGIADLGEARAYLTDPVLGPRLVECTGLVLAVPDRSIHDIFGSPDDVKFRSSMTLFARAATDPSPFRAALSRYFGGAEDPFTLALIGG